MTRTIFGSETTLFVTNNIVTGRNYSSYDADKTPLESYEEDADSIGANSTGAPIKTINELYAACEEILKTKSPADFYIDFRLFDNNILSYCEYSDKSCADDCAEGVRINSIISID